MTDPLPEAFAAALAGAELPSGWKAPLAALWWIARDPSGSAGPAWDRAHALVQDDPGPDAAWVHAHLHRIEGDTANARYWYGRAGRAVPSGSLIDERAFIAEALMRADGRPHHD